MKSKKLKYSQSPWSAEQDMENNWVIFSADGKAVAQSNTEATDPQYGTIDKQENKGNSKLIEAAPQMYDLCLLLGRELAEFYTPKQSEALNTLNKLIKKLH